MVTVVVANNEKKDMIENNNNETWVSVSEMAQREGVSTQTIRNRIKDGSIVTMTFTRGKMRGILCKAVD